MTQPVWRGYRGLPRRRGPAIAFYTGDDSGFITGTTAPVNGGLAMD